MPFLTSRLVTGTAALLNRVGLRGVNRAAKRVIRRIGRDEITIQHDGLVISGPVAAGRTLSQIASGQYEAMEIGLFKETLRPGHVVVDVGAHVGYYTLTASREVGTAGRVLAFEPDPRTRPFLEANVDRNGFENVTVVAAAASDVAEEHNMYLSANANRSSLHASAALDGLDQIVSVQSVTVDSILGSQSVDVVKVDAEGSEPKVFRGMVASLRAETVVFTEFNPSVLESAGEDAEVFAHWLFDHFGVIELIESGGTSPIQAPPHGFANLRCSGWQG